MVLNQVKRVIIKDRFKFLFLEIAISFLLIFIISYLVWVLLPIDSYPEIIGMLLYLIRSIIVFLAIPTTIYLAKKLMRPSDDNYRKLARIPVFKSHLKLYRISKSNYKYQILYGILLLFLVFIPLDFFLYLLIPEMMLHHYYSLALNVQNSYLLINNFLMFFLIAILIQSSIAFADETIYRGFISKRGSEQFNRISAVLISSYAYGFLSLLYFFEPFRIDIYNWFPIVWFISSFLIGLILSLITIRKKWLFPSIFSHSINNIIMISMIWCLRVGWSYIEILLFIYFPMLSISIVLFFWQFNRIKESVLIGVSILKNYWKNDEKRNETNSDRYFRIFIDIGIGFLVFLLGLLISI